MPALTFAHPQKGRLWLTIRGGPKRPVVGSVTPRWHLEGLPLQGHDLERSPQETPWLFEWQEIEWLFWPEASCGFQFPFSLYRNGHALSASNATESVAVSMGRVALQGFLGYVDWELRDAQGKVVWRLETEVFPARLGYKADYLSMLRELQDWAAELIFSDSAGPTYIPIDRRSKETPTTWPAYWLAAAQRLLYSLERILMAPDTRFHTAEKLTPLPQVTERSNRLTRWLARNPQYYRPDQVPVPASHLPQQIRRPHTDTPANRLVAYLIQQLLTLLASTIRQLSPLEDRERVTALRWLMERLRRAMRHPVLAQTSPQETDILDRVLPHLGPAYRAFHQQWRSLSQRIQVGTLRGLPMSPRSTPLLFEYWAFSYLVRYFSLQEEYELAEQHILSKSHGQYQLGLGKGHTPWLRFQHIHRNLTVTLWYNRTFPSSETGTLGQRPDIVLDIQPGGARLPSRYFVEVKYQLQRERNGWGPPPEGIAQLHRYRDAIVTDRRQGDTYPTALRSEGGVLLFPYPDSDDTFAAHPTHQSLQRIGIGAAPLRPGRTKQPLLDAWLASILPGEISLQDPPMPYAQHVRSELVQQLSETAWLLKLPDDPYRADRWEFITRHQAWFLPWATALPSLSAIGLVDMRTGHLMGCGEQLEMRFSHAKDLRQMGTTWPHRAPEGKYIQIRWKRWTPTNLQLPPTWGKDISRYGLRQAILHQCSDWMWLRQYHELKRWQEIQHLDLHARMSRSKDAQLLLIFFEWKQGAYCLHVDGAHEKEALWREGEFVLDIDVSKSMRVQLLENL